MASASQIALELGIPVRRVGSVELVPSVEALKLLDEVATRRHRVLAAEGFRLADLRVVADLDVLLDLTVDGAEHSTDDYSANQSITDSTVFVVDVAQPDLSWEFDLE